MKVTVEREHELKPETIKLRVEEQIVFAKARYGHLVKSYEWQWNESVLTGRVEAYGATSNARTEISDTNVKVEVDFPFVLAPFKGKVVRMLEFRLNRICSKRGH